MRSIQITIENKIGLHARPASLFVQAAQKHQSKITVSRGGATVNAKSLLNLLALEITQGTTIMIAADGHDEEDALNTLIALIKSDFGE